MIILKLSFKFEIKGYDVKNIHPLRSMPNHRMTFTGAEASFSVLPMDLLHEILRELGDTKSEARAAQVNKECREVMEYLHKSGEVGRVGYLIQTRIRNIRPLEGRRYPRCENELNSKRYILDLNNKELDFRITDKGLSAFYDIKCICKNLIHESKITINLEVLKLQNNKITNVSPLSELVYLQELDLNGNQISDIKPLSSLVNLQSLDLMVKKIIDIKPLSSLVNLQKLNLNHNQISDIKPLSSLVNLSKLLLNGNQISDINPLASLVNLQWLSLEINQISDIKPLDSLVNLQTLLLNNNQISDIDPLFSLVNLRWLHLRKNRISDEDKRNARQMLDYVWDLYF